MADIPSTPKAKRYPWAQEKVRRLNWSRLRANNASFILRGHVTTAAQGEKQFLEHMPGEIKELLPRYADARSSVPVGQIVTEFAGRFLEAMYEDGAVLPTNLSASAPEVLALALLQHRVNPQSTGVWLNLGFALRRVALYRSQDPEDLNRARLQSAQAFDRALQLGPDNRGKNIRAWTGKSFVYHLLGLPREELEFARKLSKRTGPIRALALVRVCSQICGQRRPSPFDDE
jgi:hypothetical protein